MNINIKNKVPAVWKSRSLLGYVVLFITIYYGMFLSNSIDSATIRLYLDAEKQGKVKIHLTEEGKSEEQTYTKVIHFPAKMKGHKFQVPVNGENIFLSLEFSKETNRIVITKLILERSGNKSTLIHHKSAKYVTDTNTIKRELGDNGLIVYPRPESHRLTISHIPVPSPWIVMWTFIFLTLPLIYLIDIKIDSSQTKGIRWIIQIILLFIIILIWTIEIKDKLGPYHPMIISSLFALLVLFIFKYESSRHSVFSTIGRIIIISVFIFLLFAPPINTLKSDTIKLIRGKISNAMQDENVSGWNQKINKIKSIIEKNLKKHFYNRKKMIHQNAWIKVKLFGYSPTAKAIYGKNGMFFEGYGSRRVEGNITRAFDNITDYMGLSPFSPNELEAWKELLEERYLWLKKIGIKYVFALAPTKALVYPEYLPDRIYKIKNRVDKPTRYEQLISYLKENSIVPVVDLREALLVAKKRNPKIPLFYKTDFHWNYFGSLIAYHAIIDTINQYYPEYSLEKEKLSEFKVTQKNNWVHKRFMEMVGLDPEKFKYDTYLTLFPIPNNRYGHIYHFEEKGINDNSMPASKKITFRNKRYLIREYENPSGKLSELFVIGDSFIEKTLSYFSAHARHTKFFRIVDTFPISMFKKYKPDIVVQEILNMYILRDPPRNPSIIKKM